MVFHTVSRIAPQGMAPRPKICFLKFRACPLQLSLQLAGCKRCVKLLTAVCHTRQTKLLPDLCVEMAPRGLHDVSFGGAHRLVRRHLGNARRSIDSVCRTVHRNPSSVCRIVSRHCQSFNSGYKLTFYDFGTIRFNVLKRRCAFRCML